MNRQEWIAAHTPPAGEMEMATATALEMHEDWDGPFRLIAWHMVDHADYCTESDCVVKGALLAPAASAQLGIPDGCPPALFPQVLPHLLPAIASRGGVGLCDPPIVAVSFQYEGYAADGMSLEDYEAMREMGLQITDSPAAQERCYVITADVAGNVWWGYKTRGKDQVHCRRIDDGTNFEVTANFTAMMRDMAAMLPEMYLTATEFTTEKG